MNFRKSLEVKGHAGAIYCCASHDNYIYSGSADKYVARWLIDQGVQDKFAIRFEHPVYAMSLIDNNTKLVCGLSNGALHVFDLNNRQELKHFVQHKSGVFVVEWNEQNSIFISGDADGTIAVWSAELELKIVLTLNIGKIRSINFNAAGTYFAVGGQDGSIRVFDTEFFNELHSWHAHEEGTTAIVFHPFDEELIISGGKDAHLTVSNWKNESIIQRIPAHNFVIYDLLLLNEGALFISASRDKTIKVWDTNSMQVLQRLDNKSGGHIHSVNQLCKLDESKFISCSDDKRLIIWEGVTSE